MITGRLSLIFGLISCTTFKYAWSIHWISNLSLCLVSDTWRHYFQPCLLRAFTILIYFFTIERTASGVTLHAANCWPHYFTTKGLIKNADCAFKDTGSRNWTPFCIFLSQTLDWVEGLLRLLPRCPHGNTYGSFKHSNTWKTASFSKDNKWKTFDWSLSKNGWRSVLTVEMHPSQAVITFFSPPNENHVAVTSILSVCIIVKTVFCFF